LRVDVARLSRETCRAYRIRRARVFAAGLRKIGPGAAAATARLHAQGGFRRTAACARPGGIKKTILVGHSDGASIATIYAGGRQDFRVRGLVLLAPHFFVEEISIESIAAAKVAYETGDLRARLARHHGDNVDVAFRGWNDAWLDPGFRNWRIDDAVAHVRVPILIVQGKDDQYGTLAQVRLAETDAYCPVETAILDQCGHSPQIDRPEATLEAISEFVHRVLALHEGPETGGLRGYAFYCRSTLSLPNIGIIINAK
jgi:alpha-beta hydrolase superfamily lysophospholipase